MHPARHGERSRLGGSTGNAERGKVPVGFACLPGSVFGRAFVGDQRSERVQGLIGNWEVEFKFFPHRRAEC